MIMQYRSRSQSFPRWTQEAGEMVVSAEEGMVPGLDFCNHKEHSTAKWTIFGTPGLEVYRQTICSACVSRCMHLHFTQPCRHTDTARVASSDNSEGSQHCEASRLV